MQLTGEQALNDPEVLKLCIPGCEELDKTSDTGFAAKVRAKVGPVSARFAGAVTLSELNPPESYTISGEGKGGAAGFAKGGAKVHLAEDGGATTLSYEVDAQVGGKLAQIGSRLISGTAKKMADDFFGTDGTSAHGGGSGGSGGQEPAPRRLDHRAALCRAALAGVFRAGIGPDPRAADSKQGNRLW
jgi:carbon monoxide dehydrogenase subunit G